MRKEISQRYETRNFIVVQFAKPRPSDASFIGVHFAHRVEYMHQCEKNADEMLRIFSTFNAICSYIRGVIQEYQTQLI